MRRRSLYTIMFALLLVILVTLHVKISHMRESFVGKPKQQYVIDVDKQYCNAMKDKVCDELCAKNGFVGIDQNTAFGTGLCKGKNDCFCDGYYVPPPMPAPAPASE